jgi:histidine triad (HIT) family protein
MQKADCIFCKIASGAIPSLRVLDTPDCLAFLDIGPLAPGHTLLIPKDHHESILDAPADVLTRLLGHVPRLAAAILKVTGASGLNMLQNTGESAGQAVFHLHIHLIPRRDGDRLGFRWNTTKYGTGEGEAIQARLLNELGLQR